MRFTKTACRWLSCFFLNLNYYRIERQFRSDERRLIESLLASLKRRPYWQAGHSKVARLFLRKSEVQKAYYAAQTYRALSGEVDSEAEYLLGVCYLRSGSLAQAETVLAKAHQRHPHNYEITEELAAALMGLGKYLEAINVIETIPLEQRSGELQAALAGCETALKKPD